MTPAASFRHLFNHSHHGASLQKINSLIHKREYIRESEAQKFLCRICLKRITNFLKHGEDEEYNL